MVRVVAEARWSKELVQGVAGTPGDLDPVPDGELDEGEIEEEKRPHEPRGHC